MDPGFLALYKRGNYFRRDLSSLNPDERRRKREERERFAMAVIGFCLKYDRAFRKHFLRAVCGIGNPTKLEEIKTAVEEKRWGDLQLLTTQGIYIIEGKIHADLKPWQNFGEDEFWDEGGYGAAINAAFENDVRKRYYIVLGYPKPLDRPKRKGIECRKVPWEILERGFPETDVMAADLADCLSELGVEAFYLRKTKAMKIKSSLEEAAMAVEIISGTLKSLGIKEHKGVSGGSYYPNRENWYFGNDLPMPRATDKKDSTLARLKELVKPKSGETLGWIGWEAAQIDKSRRSVWFYCGTEKIRQALENSLKEALSKDYIVSSSVPEDETAKRYLYVASSKDAEVKSIPDQRWFLSVFKALGVQTADLG